MTAHHGSDHPDDGHPFSGLPDSGSDGDVASLVLACDPATVRQARAFVLARCRAGSVAQDTCDTAVLLTSELVTNAILHGRSEARLAIVATPGLVHVEVGDDNSRHPVPVEADGAALDGRGIAIVDMLAAAWGVRDDPYGKVVWFDVLTAEGAGR